MTRVTQGVLLTLVGAVLIRITIDDTYLRYVNTWMRWPILACGLVLVLLSVSDLATGGRHPDADQAADPAGNQGPHHVPRAAWLLFLPPLVIFFITPPALGAFLAGLAVSESRFSSHALGEVLPLQIIFTATLFVSLGMLFDPSFLLERPVLVLLAVLALLFVLVD